MTDREFINLCLQLVADYTNQHMDKTDCESITTDNVYTRRSRTGRRC